MAVLALLLPVGSFHEKKNIKYATSDGFRLNFSGAMFCFSHQLVGFLFVIVSGIVPADLRMRKMGAAGKESNN